MSSPQVINYADAQEKFHTLSSLHGAETWHGWLCAFFSVSDDLINWYQKICNWLDIEEEADDAVKVFLADFSQWSLKNLSETSSLPVLLLPNDEVPLNERIDALAAWAEAYLLGFAERTSAAKKLSEEAQEALQDMAAVSQMILGEEDDTSDNEQEENFESILEHVKVSVQLLFMECSLLEKNTAQATQH